MGIDVYQILTLQPGGSGAPNVYTNVPALYKALSAYPSGTRIVRIDDSIAPVVWPAGSYPLMDGVTFEGIANFNNPSGTAILTFADGAHLTAGVIEFRVLSVHFSGTTPVITVPASEELWLFMDQANIEVTGGTAPFLQVANTGFADILMIEDSVLGEGTHAVADAGAGPSNLFILGYSSFIRGNAVSGAGATVQVNDNGAVSPPQGAGVTLKPLSNARTIDVATIFAVDVTGATDCSAYLQAAFNYLAASGQAAAIRGTPKVAAQVTLPSYLVVEQAPDSVILSGLSGAGTPTSGSLFLSPSPTVIATTTISASNTVGAQTVHMAAPPAVGSYVLIASAANVFQQATYRVDKVAGAVVTLDRPVLLTFVNADPVTVYASVPQGIKWHGNGGKITGLAVRLFEFVTSWDCEVDSVNVDASGGNVPNDMFGSFDVGCYRCVWRNCKGDGMLSTGVAGAVASAGWAIESTEECGFEDCEVKNITGPGYLVDDALNCWSLNSAAMNTHDGIDITADGNTIGCQGFKLTGGNYSGNAHDGISIANGSRETRIVSVTASYNASMGIRDQSGGGTFVSGAECVGNTASGIQVSAAAAPWTQIVNAYCASSGTVDVQLVTDCDIDGLRIKSDTASLGGILISAAAITVRIRGLEIPAVASGNALSVGAGALCRLDQADITAQVGGLSLIAVAGKLYCDNVSLINGNVGVAVANGGTLRAGLGFDAHTCTTAVTLAGTGVWNRGTVTGAGGGTAVPWPDLKATDQVILMPTGAVFTGYVSAYTPGTGFTVTDAGSGTYKYLVQ